MRILNYFFILSVIISSCRPEDSDSITIPELPKNYGKGMYILTDQGVSFCNIEDADSLRVVKNNIYSVVNGADISQPKSMIIEGDQAFIIGDKVYSVDIETFGSLGSVSGFFNPVSCVRVDNNRLFVVDKGDATVKIVDLEKQQIQSHIETGDGTHPTKIVNNWFRTIIMNGGGSTKAERDSSIVSIDYFTKYDFVERNNFSGKLDIGYNPNSAVFGTDDLWVLCKGIYDVNNSANNIEGIIYQVWPYNTMATFFNKPLSGIYNANSLAINTYKNKLFFTAEEGIYITDANSSLSVNLHISNVNANCIAINIEKINDSTWVEYLYTNDANQSGKVLKYEAWTGFPIDTITVNGNILEVAFY
tara:strand:+ start:5080 stop:6162 length:1083 start_codon:yes stop_codon:yes gene_type:complete